MLLKVYYKSSSSRVLHITLVYKMHLSFDMHKEFDVKQKKALSIPSVVPLLEAFVAAWLFAMAYRWCGAKLI